MTIKYLTKIVNSAMSQEARKTSETDIKLSLNLRGKGNYHFDTEIPFFDHMLSHIAKHGQMELIAITALKILRFYSAQLFINN